MEDDAPRSHVEKLLDPEQATKKQVSFYVDAQIYEMFMRICKKRGVSGSRVVAALMQDFVGK